MAIGIDEESRTGRAPATGWAAIRPLVLRLHFYAGVFVGPFLLVAALTGIAYVWTPQLEQAVYAHELHVPAAAGAIPLDQQVLVARGRVPDGKVIGVRPAPSATDTTQVIFDRPGLAPSYRYTVFVNPHDGEVRGALETYGSGQALPVRGWIDTLHRNLHLGDFGRLYSELAASWLWVITLLGLALWLGRRRRLRAVLLPSGGKPGRRRLRSWHGSTGLWIAAGLLFLSATGLTWSLHAGANITSLRSSLDWTTPSLSPGKASPGDVGWQAVRDATARAGLADPVEIRPPSGGGYVVQQVGRSWPSKQDSMTVDPGTGTITGTLRFADYPLAAKLSRWGIDAHMGLLFGVVNQIALTVLGVALVCVVGWGYRMWWLRGRGGWSRGQGRSEPVVTRMAGAGGLPETRGGALSGGSGRVPSDGGRLRDGAGSGGAAEEGGLPHDGGLPEHSRSPAGAEVLKVGGLPGGGSLEHGRLADGAGVAEVGGSSGRAALPEVGELPGGPGLSMVGGSPGAGASEDGQMSGSAGVPKVDGLSGGGRPQAGGGWSGRAGLPEDVGSSSGAGVQNVGGRPSGGELAEAGQSLGGRGLLEGGRPAESDEWAEDQAHPGQVPTRGPRSDRSRDRGRFGRMPARGAWRRIPGRVLAPVLVGVAVVGWFLPVLGVSLLGFLAVDCLLGLRREVAR